MQGKIGLEEHFAIPDTLSDSKGFLADNTWPELESRLMDMQYLLGHAYPNFYFHVTTAYNILRHNGVEVGKADFIGKP